MTQPTCQACAAPTDAALCHPCTRKLRTVLDDLPQWLAELATTVTQQAKTSSPDSGKATKRFEQPMPLHLAAAELLAQARRGIASWVTHVAGPRGLTPPPGRTLAVTRHVVRVRVIRNRWLVNRDVVEIRPAERTPLTALVTWLANHAWEIRHVDQAGEILIAARALRDACRRMVDNLGRRWAGPCTAQVVERPLEMVVDGDGDTRTVRADVGQPLGEPRECGADLRTRPGDPTITCRACGATYDPIERAQWIIGKARDAQAAPDFIAHALTDAGWPVKGTTIRQWASRGKLFSYRDDHRGRPMYRFGDVLDIVNTARARAGAEETTRRELRA